ncbi:MAG: ABC transporter substrate-binding protein [Acidimicrobiales bacterium]|nr:ABC transporter substrate-binding protein [Acidimicrobiales bacterium]
MTARWVAPGLIVANAVFDPLAAFDIDGKPQPYLAERFESTSDYRSWTITLRPGVSFHNGQTLDAEALMVFIAKMRQSPLVGPAFDPIDPDQPVTKIDDRTVRVNMRTPWANYPAALTGQGGMVAAPEQLNNPDASWRADHPIGTGPFKLLQWNKGRSLVAEKNPTYWRSGLPYLDQIEFRPVVDNSARDTSLLDGSVDMEFTTFNSSVRRLKDEAASGRVQLVRDDGPREQLFLLANMDRPPLDDVRVRRAIAHAFNWEEYVRVTNEDPDIRSTNVFSKTSEWYVESDFPQFDPDAARELVADYEAEKGPIAFTLKTTDNPENQSVGQAVAKMLTEVGMDVRAVSVDQAIYATQVVFGEYDLAYVRLFGATDPDADYHWFTSKNAPLVGEGRVGLNVARMRDPQVDAALERGRTSTDQATRKQAYADFQRRLNELVPYIWISESVKYVAAVPRVHDFVNQTLPDGRPAMPVQQGVTRLTETWLD